MAVTHSVVLYDPKETSAEVKAAAGFLAGYSGRTREAYTLDLRQFYGWCDRHHLQLFEVTRTHIELYARELEELGRAPATIGRRLSTVAGLYRYAAEEGVIEHSPAVHVRRPRLDYESHAVGLDRNELGAFLVAAGLSSARDHALCSLLALNGLRISEALGADIDQLGLERGHRTLVVHRKGGKTVTIPLAPRTARAVDLAVGERFDGPIFLGHKGEKRPSSSCVDDRRCSGEIQPVRDACASAARASTRARRTLARRSAPSHISRAAIVPPSSTSSGMMAEVSK